MYYTYVLFSHLCIYLSGADLGILRGGFWAKILQGGGGGVRVQVRRNFHILTSKKKPLRGGVKTPNPPGSATAYVFIFANVSKL